MESQFKRQEGGSHYKGRGIEPLEYTLANELDFCQGSIVKYITRFREKNGSEDLKKVIHYAQFLLEKDYFILSDIQYEGKFTDPTVRETNA